LSFGFWVIGLWFLGFFGFWFLVFGFWFWFLVFGFWFLVFVFCFLFFGFCFLVFGFWFLVFGFWFLVFGFWFLVFGFFFGFVVSYTIFISFVCVLFLLPSGFLLSSLLHSSVFLIFSSHFVESLLSFSCLFVFFSSSSPLLSFSLLSSLFVLFFILCRIKSPQRSSSSDARNPACRPARAVIFGKFHLQKYK
jgi:hypothetical protein